MIKNYEYGLLDPTSNMKLISDQMSAGHRYYNKLVEIDRGRRAEISTILAGHPDTEVLAARVADLARQRDEAQLAIKATRKATRSRSETAQMRERVKEIAAVLKVARAELKAGSPSVDPSVEITSVCAVTCSTR